MNKEVLRNWVATLRCGEYPQAKSALRSIVDSNHSYGYCCLGVLCDLYRRETGKGIWNHGWFCTEINGITEEEDALPNMAVVKWLEHDSTDLYIPTPLVEEVLGQEKADRIRIKGGLDPKAYPTTFPVTVLNDFGCTFSEIADLIERAFLQDE